MPNGALPDLTPWRRRALTIPPNSAQAWIQLAAWEIWMGTLLCVIIGFGTSFIVTAPDKIVVFSDLTNCYRPPPIPIPCDRAVYQGGLLNAAFTALCGLMMVAVAAWLLCELWLAVEPKPITDDFLKMLHDSFSRDWRNPLTWPWARALWAYGFTLVGAALAAAVALTAWMLVKAPEAARAPAIRVETSQSFRVGQ